MTVPPAGGRVDSGFRTADNGTGCLIPVALADSGSERAAIWIAAAATGAVGRHASFAPV
jgi:hypothetical protein